MNRIEVNKTEVNRVNMCTVNSFATGKANGGGGDTPVVPGEPCLLLESGGRVLLESGGRVLLENNI